MKSTGRNIRHLLKALVFIGIALPFSGCAPGTVYVGVAAPGPWVGYPPGYYPGRHPGMYGRPWYSPDEEDSQELKPVPENGIPEARPDSLSAP